jgi:hypothetical protein
MDKVIQDYRYIPDKDLNICYDNGVAYQYDMSASVEYDQPYFDKCFSYEDQDIALAINNGRINLVKRHFGLGNVLDIGVGSGEFIKKRPHTFGYDINPAAIAWLKENGKWREDFGDFNAFTFWDVIEHVKNPFDYFSQIIPGSFLFTSLPIFVDLYRIRDSKHYRPNEHYYYWTKNGFIDWMKAYGFRFLEYSDFETRAGRDRIGSFAFRLGY